jgi:hypothetical protein
LTGEQGKTFAVGDKFFASGGECRKWKKEFSSGHQCWTLSLLAK